MEKKGSGGCSDSITYDSAVECRRGEERMTRGERGLIDEESNEVL